MFKRVIILFCFLCLTISSNAQNLKALDSLKPKQVLDTLFIDRDINNWSIRFFANYKQQKFALKDDADKLSFVPNNNLGVGVGLGTSKLIVDIAINIKGKKENQTQRFDMQGSLILGSHHLIGLLVQRYKGFNVSNNFNEPESFRDDILSVSVGLSYLYTLDEISFSSSIVENRLSKINKKYFITAGFGGFIIYDNFSADSSIIPDGPVFNEDSSLDDFKGTGIGISCGMLSVFILPGNFFASLNVVPGVGVMYKTVGSETTTDQTVKKPMLYRLDFDAGIGYNWKRYYLTFGYGTGFYSTDLNYGLNYFFSNTKAKVALGYKIKSNKKLKTPL
jgi:hypothetical protein